MLIDNRVAHARASTGPSPRRAAGLPIGVLLRKRILAAIEAGRHTIFAEPNEGGVRGDRLQQGASLLRVGCRGLAYQKRELAGALGRPLL